MVGAKRYKTNAIKSDSCDASQLFLARTCSLAEFFLPPPVDGRLRVVGAEMPTCMLEGWKKILNTCHYMLHRGAPEVGCQAEKESRAAERITCFIMVIIFLYIFCGKTPDLPCQFKKENLKQMYLCCFFF